MTTSNKNKKIGGEGGCFDRFKCINLHITSRPSPVILIFQCYTYGGSVVTTEWGGRGGEGIFLEI